jgi:hypothetical protein
MHMESQTIGYKRASKPQVEMQFVKTEHAQRAAALLDNSKFDNPEVSINTFFEDQGRRLILEFNPAGSRPSDIVSFVFDVVDAISAVRPLTRAVTIPIVKK